MTKIIQRNTGRLKFDDFDEARAFTGFLGLKNGELVDINGHTSQLDGGQGVFQWDATNTTADDDGTIIKLTNAATGRLIRDTQRISIQHFGAK
jgi:hypothetical protein